MTHNPPPYESYWAFFRDVGIAILLFILGALIANFLSHALREIIARPYLVTFSIGMAPLFWFLKRCLIHNYDWWDYAAFCLCMLAVSALRNLLPADDVSLLDFMLLLVGLSLLLAWKKLRARFRTVNSEPEA